jgi:hypothetical protein
MQTHNNEGAPTRASLAWSSSNLPANSLSNQDQTAPLVQICTLAPPEKRPEIKLIVLVSWHFEWCFEWHFEWCFEWGFLLDSMLAPECL